MKERVSVPAVLEVAAHARAQALRLADVEDLARRVAKDVAARLQPAGPRASARSPFGRCLLGGGHRRWLGYDPNDARRAVLPNASVLVLRPRRRSLWPVSRAAGPAARLRSRLLAGLGVGFVLVPKWPAPDEQAARAAAELHLLGRELSLDARAPATALERVRRYVARRFVARLRRRQAARGVPGRARRRDRQGAPVRARARTRAIGRARSCAAYVEAKRPGALELPVPVTLEPRDRAADARAR